MKIVSFENRKEYVLTLSSFLPLLVGKYKIARDKISLIVYQFRSSRKFGIHREVCKYNSTLLIVFGRFIWFLGIYGNTCLKFWVIMWKIADWWIANSMFSIYGLFRKQCSSTGFSYKNHLLWRNVSKKLCTVFLNNFTNIVSKPKCRRSVSKVH